MITYGRHVLSFAALVLALSGALVLSACEVEEEPVVEEEPMTTTPEDDLTDISALEGDPLQYVGQTVTVDGEVSEVFGQNAFTITGGLFTGDLTVIVPPSQATSSVMEGDDLQITGTVEAFVVTEIERDYGFDLTPEIEAELEESEPVLVAETMTPVGAQNDVGGALEQGAENLEQEAEEEL